MMNQILTNVLVDDALREAENARLGKKVKQSRKNKPSIRLAKLACRFGLSQTC